MRGIEYPQRASCKGVGYVACSSLSSTSGVRKRHPHTKARVDWTESRAWRCDTKIRPLLNVFRSLLISAEKKLHTVLGPLDVLEAFGLCCAEVLSFYSSARVGQHCLTELSLYFCEDLNGVV
jgi:hypothetical protein